MRLQGLAAKSLRLQDGNKQTRDLMTHPKASKAKISRYHMTPLRLDARKILPSIPYFPKNTVSVSL